MNINIVGKDRAFVQAVGTEGNKVALLLNNQTFLYLEEGEIELIAQEYKAIKATQGLGCQNCGPTEWRPHFGGNQ